jgi:EmrB/QacA subfamily drug resistance transporter
MTLLAYGGQQPCDRAQLSAPTRLRHCPQRDKPWVLATAILGSSLVFIEGSVVNLALPAIQADLEIDSAAVQWVVNTYLLVLGAFLLVGGSLGDRFGLRRVFVLGSGIFGFGALACALAPSLSILLIARCVQGFGGALLVPASLALIASYFTEAERGRAIGTWAGASALTTAIGPVLGGWLVDHWSWTAVFFLVVPLALAGLAISLWRVPRDTTNEKGPLDYPGALLLAAALTALIYCLLNLDSGWRLAVYFGVAAISGIAFLWREKRFHAPVLPLELFASRPFSGANLMTFLLYAALSGALYFLPFNLIQVQGYSATQAGAAFLPMTLTLGLGSTLAGDLILRFSPRSVLTVGPAIAGLGFLVLAWPGTNTSFVVDFLPAILLIGVGMTISVAPLTTVVMGSVREHQAGVASGINNTVARLAGVFAVATLTSFAIARFSSSLRADLEQSGLPATVLERVMSGAGQLAELEPPPDVAASVAELIVATTRASYIATFRSIAVICSLLAFASAVVAWISLREVTGQAAQDQQSQL